MGHSDHTALDTRVMGVTGEGWSQGAQRPQHDRDRGTMAPMTWREWLQAAKNIIFVEMAAGSLSESATK